MAYDLSKEVNEAISAGEHALLSLRKTQQYLSSAENWGIVDIFGGGLVTNLIKHSKLDQAKQYMELARRDLQRFQKELDDVDEYLPDIDISGLVTFADFFFDGLVADVFVQSKISEAQKQISKAIYQVESIVNRLRHEQG